MIIAQPGIVLAYLPLYLAVEGTEHELITCNGPLEAIQTIIKNQADMMIGDPFIFDYVDYEKHGLKLIAGFANKVFHSLITFDPFLKDLSGKTIVTYPRPSTAYFLYRYDKKRLGFGPDIQTPFNTELGPLLTQEADAAIVLEPNTSYALANGARVLKDYSHIKAVMTGCVAKKNVKLPDLKKGIYVFLNDKKRTLEVAKKYFPLVQEDILTKAIENLRSINPYCTRFDEEDIITGKKIRKIKKDIGRFLV